MKTSLMIHGGAGTVESSAEYKKGLDAVLALGKSLLENGVSALDAVVACVSLLEDNPLFNAGKGSVLNAEGRVEMDAAVMDGNNLKAGAVAGISGIKNPVQLARLVMDKTPHVLLVSDGATTFARREKVAFESPEYFLTTARMEQLAKAKKTGVTALDHSMQEGQKMGTVGAVARDRNGNLAAATSTGGLVNKKFGRIGDTPIIGAGTYADNETCAISATGIGEELLRVVIGKTVADIIFYRGVDAAGAAKQAVEILVQKVNGRGGIIVIDKNGAIGFAHSTPILLAAGYSPERDDFFTF
ncbi:isoaspartyl peptidase/L-asparaginase [bacterium]|nr:isoaspartyl peptidase/L-asparaginase [bacterium]MCI0565883.1 isoaspartyl peptidase/L-asparaginase [bacterium]MCI0680253.1 isoaspartyl peptidase/L-asparaginase [bacterium]